MRSYSDRDGDSGDGVVSGAEVAREERLGGGMKACFLKSHVMLCFEVIFVSTFLSKEKRSVHGLKVISF